MNIGQAIVLTKSIYDDGEDHHPPGYIAWEGETVVIRDIISDRCIAVSHPHVLDNAFYVSPDEWKIPEQSS